jgi:hypothetical protein
MFRESVYGLVHAGNGFQHVLKEGAILKDA